MGKLVLFDGNSLVHRAFHAFQKGEPLTVRKTGEVVSAVYGFALMVLKVLGELKPNYCAIAFDRVAPTFRHLMFEQYKENRPETPDELVSQLGRAKELTRAFGIPVYEMDGYEADDILGTLSREAGLKNIETIIVTGDADAMQLVSPGISVLYPKPGRAFGDTALFDEAAVREKYGVSPELVADLKGLKGDPSDNIPGVPGIGEKTAAKLIQQFGSIDRIYQHIEEVSPPRIRESLRENEARARESKKLATIVTDVPVTLKLEGGELTRDNREQVIKLFRELEFVSLIGRLPEVREKSSKTESQVKTQAAEGNYHTINTATSLSELIRQMQAAGSFAFDVETTSLNAIEAGLVGISLASTQDEAYYIPVGHVGLEPVTQLPVETVARELKPVMEDRGLAKLAHNGKYDTTVLAEHGIKVNNLAFDTMIAAYLLGEKNLNLKALAFSRLGLEMTPISELIGSGKKTIPMSQVPIGEVVSYCGNDSLVTRRLAEVFKPELEKLGLWELFSQVEMPLVPVLVAMERNGVLLDAGILRRLSERFGREIQALEEKIYQEAGTPFNIDSPRQLGMVLFEKLHLPTGRRTKSGYSTEAAILEELRPAHPIVGMLLEYRTLSKLKSTYIDALPALINPKTGRVHTSFNQTRTTTGRLSSSDPNLQNIPARGEQGREIRQAFIAAPGSFLLAGDYSQIDLRVLAHLSQDPRLLQAFRENRDAHADTASQLFHVSPEKVTMDMRRLAKTVNFGVIYGMSDYGLEQATELSRQQAHDFIVAYFEKSPGVKSYLEQTRVHVREKGYVQTLLGRRRYIPEINSPNRQVREGAERMAINMPVQGTSADIIKVAMVRLYREMEKARLKSQMLLQVHDELIFEVPEGEVAVMRKLVPDVMSSACMLSVPLKVEMKTGRNWGEME